MSALSAYLTGAKESGKFKKKKPKKGPNPDKAAQMLEDDSANGKKLTGKQQRYFGYIVGKGK